MTRIQITGKYASINIKYRYRYDIYITVYINL